MTRIISELQLELKLFQNFSYKLEINYFRTYIRTEHFSVLEFELK